MNEIQVREADQSIMKALPSEKVRKSALYIMASDLGIPTDFVDNPQTSLMAATAIMKALNMRLTYGAVPGIHVHAVKRNTKITDSAGNDRWVDAWQIQDGEKLWKDSMVRHARDGGFRWAFDDKHMSRTELEDTIRGMGFTEAIPGNAAGVWSAVKTENHVALGVEPIKVTGVWFGKIKNGFKWSNDNLPTGTSPADVALRRAHKRAIMSSEYGLKPLTDDTPEVRASEFVGEMVRRTADEDKASSMLIRDDVEEMLDVDWEPIDISPEEEKQSIVSGWTTPAAAKSWAEDRDYPNVDAEFVELVEAFGKLTKANLRQVLSAWYDKVLEAAPITE